MIGSGPGDEFRRKVAGPGIGPATFSRGRDGKPYLTDPSDRPCATAPDKTLKKTAASNNIFFTKLPI